MGATRTMSAEWLPGAAVAAVMSGVGALLSWRVASAKQEGSGESEIKQLEHESTGLRQDIRDLRDDLRSGAAELRALNSMLVKLQASQDVVNVMNAKAMEAIAKKQESHGETISDHAATLRILTELLKRKGLLE